jgi:phage gpG-like protein
MQWIEGHIPDFADLLKDAIQNSSTLIQGFVGAEMGNRAMSESFTKGKSNRAFDESTARNDTDQLRTASGRLFRSFLVVNGKPKTADGIFELAVTEEGVTMIIGSKVEYAAIHEYGGTIPAHFVKSNGRMHRYFWARYYATGDKKYMYTALKVLKHGGLNIKAITMRKRSYLAPAMIQFESVGMQKVMSRLANQILERLNG